MLRKAIGPRKKKELARAAQVSEQADGTFVRMKSVGDHTETPRSDSIARLLLLLSQVKLDPARVPALRENAAQIGDWDTFTAIAARKFIVPYCHQHLIAHASDLVPPATLRKLESLARASIMSVLQLQAAQTRFHTRCVEPTGAQYAYIKGITLPSQFGFDIGPRYCRDVDVLVAERDFERVIRTAMASGYRVILGYEPLEFAQTKRDLDFVLRCTEVVTLVGTDGVPIEVHRRLDKTGLDFDLRGALSQPETIRIGDKTVHTLQRNLHAVYLCYHHSRHLWSRLHWLADIDMIMKSPGFDREAVLALAETVGIQPTVQAAFEFAALSAGPFPNLSEPSRNGGQQFLRACLLNLDGDLELEYELRKGRTLPDFMSAWQISSGRYSAIRRKSMLMRFRPSLAQYRKSRFPKQLFWLYSIQRAIAFLNKSH